jgi:porin
MKWRTSAIAGLSLALVGTSFATSFAAGAPPEEEVTYSGDFLSRSTLTGDWGGTRNDLAEKGLTFDANLTQIEQGVVDGGKSGQWEYGGRGNLTFHLDTQKLGLWPGGFLTVELEGNWSQGINGNTGALSPVNTNQLFPLVTGTNVAMPAWNFAQFLSRYAGVTFGKLDTSGADMNEFAHGKGDIQFFNTAFELNPIALIAPYSTLGAGVIVLPTADINQAILSLMTVSASGKSSTAGFDDLTGPMFAGEARMRTDFFGLTGHQLVGGLYSWKDYTSVDQRLGFVIENRSLVRVRKSWSAYYNFDQYLYQPDKDKDQGFGVFGRFGASQGDPVPAQYFYSIGVGAKGPIESRPFDQCGIGYYYSSNNNPVLQLPFTTREFLRDEWGFEAYYSFAVTPWLYVTPDVQVIGPALKRQIGTGLGALRNGEPVDTATVLGFRARLMF